MIAKDTDKEFDENDAFQYDSVIDARARESPSLDDPLSNERPEATKGYISKFPFVTWTLVSIVGIALCLIHAHQDSLWQWTGDTAADAQSLQAKAVVSVFSAVIGACVAALLSRALISLSFLILRYRGASFNQLATVIEGYAPSRIPVLAAGGGWASSMLVILILGVGAFSKQIAVVSMGVNFVATNNTKVSYTRNYSSCAGTDGLSGYTSDRIVITNQAFSAITTPNSSYTNEFYDSAIPPELAGDSRFDRVLPYVDVSCVQLDSVGFNTVMPPLNSSGYTWQTMVTLPVTNSFEDMSWVNCTLKAGFATATSTCNDTKCDTVRTSTEITPFREGGYGLSENLKYLFERNQPASSKTQNLLITWLLGGDILRKSYSMVDILAPSSIEFIEDRLANLGTAMTRVICDVNYHPEFQETNIPDSPITSNYIEHSYYQYNVLWRWPFYILAGCIVVVWMLCMMAMWLAPESRVLSTDWLLNQYISRNQNGYLSGKDLLPAHDGISYQVFDDNANGDVGNIVISNTESRKLDKYNRVIQNKQYQ